MPSRAVAVLQVKGENKDINVKRLPKKPTPPRFGRKLTASQKEFATHICLDCGYIYSNKWASLLQDVGCHSILSSGKSMCSMEVPMPLCFLIHAMV